MIVWGESDRMIPPAYGPAFGKKPSPIRGLVTVPEAGHMVILEKTQRGGGGGGDSRLASTIDRGVSTWIVD